MTPTPDETIRPEADPREALERSYREATEEQPQNFRDEANDEKVVEIGADKTRDPIQGLDPVEEEKRER